MTWNIIIAVHFDISPPENIVQLIHMYCESKNHYCVTLISILGYNNAVKYTKDLIININKKLQKYGSNANKIKQTLGYILNRDK